MDVKYFLAAVDVGDDNRASELIGDMPNKALEMAYRRTLCNVKNTESPGEDSEYRSMLSIILNEMKERGIAPSTSAKRSR